jgi:hypothetical protein
MYALEARIPIGRLGSGGASPRRTAQRTRWSNTR